ncbi:ankyrin repeat domain-containing protein [Streptomyces sp. NPDC056049]|uniref:ankyrin repeat domain-containing protein n=1 Tax=Streptomyces sp. NPDC056049 TaxID=3345693 RepID=UPI0035DE9DDA
MSGGATPPSTTGQAIAGQPIPGQTTAGQPSTGQSTTGQLIPGQPIPGLAIPGRRSRRPSGLRAAQPAGLSPEDAAAWTRIRRHAVPEWMIERATEARLAGDWRTACAVAAVDVPADLDPERIAERYGTEVAARVADDLRHLAPDLLRWHLPRVLGGHTTLTPCRRIVLAVYGPREPVLSVTTSPMLAGPQRLALRFGPAVDPVRDTLHGLDYTTEDWTAARRFWDARRTAELRHCAGGTGSERLPFLHHDGTPLTPEELPAEDPGHADPAARAEWVAVLQGRGDHVEAFAAAGLDLDLTAPLPERPTRPPLDVHDLIGRTSLDLTRIVPEIRLLQAAGRGTSFRVRVTWRGDLRFDLDPAEAPAEARTLADAPASPGAIGSGGGAAHAPARVSALARPAEGVAYLPSYVWQRLPDIGLLRSGRIRPEALHPLVAAALFPRLGPAAGPGGPTPPAPVHVRCRGEWHQVVSRGGTLDVPHTEQEQRRELALRAFGGAVSGCFATRHAWTSGEGRLPGALRDERRAFFLHVQHGDTPGVLALLDAGTDPLIRDGDRRSLLHLLHLLDHRALLPRLLAAGLDLEAVDRNGRTPLVTAVSSGGSPDLVRDLVAAGARIDATDEMELSLAQIVRKYARTDLMFLRRRVLAEHPGIGSDWYDDYIEERDGEPDWDEEPPEDARAYAEEAPTTACTTPAGSDAGVCACAEDAPHRGGTGTEHSDDEETATGP